MKEPNRCKSLLTAATAIAVSLTTSTALAGIQHFPSLDKLVVNDNDASRASSPTGAANGNYRIDASISTYDYGGTKYWIFPWFEWISGSPTNEVETFHTITSGLINRPATSIKKPGMPQSTIMPGSGGEKDGDKWITNTYQDGNNGVLAFVHVEQATADTNRKDDGPGRGRIGLAYASWTGTSGIAQSTPNDPEFEYVGHVVKPYADPSSHNVHGTPYVIHNVNGVDYFYIYFHENSNLNGTWGHIGVARSPVGNVLHRAKQGLTSNWYKYDNGVWRSGFTGDSSPMNMWPLVVHGDAAKSTCNNKYYLAGYVQRDWEAVSGANPSNAGEIVIYESSDALNWTEALSFKSHTAANVDLQYLSITDEDGSDNGEFGDRMRLYAIEKDKTSGLKKRIWRYTLGVTDTCS